MGDPTLVRLTSDNRRGLGSEITPWRSSISRRISGEMKGFRHQAYTVLAS